MDDSREMDEMTPEELAEVQRVHDVMIKAMREFRGQHTQLFSRVAPSILRE